MSGLNSSYCTGACAQGYYCPEGSTSAYEIECGGDHTYCPAGSGYPYLASAGQKTLGYDSNTSSSSVTKFAVLLCDFGHYCKGGVEYPCPVGRYGEREGLKESSCSGECLPGEYCPLASVTPTKCSKGTFCPDGVSFVLCPEGSFGAVKGLLDKR